MRMNRGRGFAALAVVTVLLVLLVSCSSTIYLERETPPADVSPSTGERSEDAPKAPDRNTIVMESTRVSDWSPAERSEGMRLEMFRAAYTKAARPSIMFYLNRELSADVIPWRSASEGVDIRRTSRTESGDESSVEKESVRVETFSRPGNAPAERALPGEEWTWAFEDGLYNAFLEADASLIDRDMAMRKAAASDQGSYADIIELHCLNEEVDILVEVLVLKSPGSTLGYEFKATGKSVKDSRLLLLVTSLDWETELVSVETSIAATDHGYMIEDHTILPGVDQMASYLASDIMSELVQRWEADSRVD